MDLALYAAKLDGRSCIKCVASNSSNVEIYNQFNFGKETDTFKDLIHHPAGVAAAVALTAAHIQEAARSNPPLWIRLVGTVVVVPIHYKCSAL
ncbi:MULTISPECIES: hypothetical protein [unclassified Nostoc]|uniref:hypothetical protein n=1 Tax=unclassified Nostoc TaxID=2593658 RepID=UPI002AD3AB78|nr:hypothetical protein [Nostoc sp. DedQUE03]MDZ7976440.1 hypothetical protein [Nostoc sp. DedQUE03]MDZ8042766.1 hypothetical protein [Nostoc sp. DedQUE02]